MNLVLGKDVGIGTTTPGDLLHVNGKIRASQICYTDGTNCKDISTGWAGAGLDVYQARTVNTVYTASTDGFVVAWGTETAAGHCYLTGYVNGSAVTYASFRDDYGTISRGNIVFPVPKNATYQIGVSTCGTPTASFIAMTAGSGGNPWTLSGNNIIYSTGDVGIGIASPGSTLDVKGTLRLSGSSSGYVGFAPSASAGSTTYTWPSSDGSSGQVLSTSGSGALSWVTASAGGSSNFIGARATRSSASGAIGFSSWATVNWNAEDWDTSAMHDNITNSNRVTVPSGEGGKYIVNFQVTNNAGGVFVARIRKNGTTLYECGSGSGTSQLNCMWILNLAAADYIEIQVHDNSTGSGVDVNSTSYLSLSKHTSSPSLSGTYLQDTDGNTKVETEKVGNEDFVRISTAGTERLTVGPTGNVGIGTTTPAAKLDVQGEIKLGNTSLVCNAINEGQQRYNSTSKKMEFCNGTAWTAFATSTTTGLTACRVCAYFPDYGLESCSSYSSGNVKQDTVNFGASTYVSIQCY